MKAKNAFLSSNTPIKDGCHQLPFTAVIANMEQTENGARIQVCARYSWFSNFAKELVSKNQKC